VILPVIITEIKNQLEITLHLNLQPLREIIICRVTRLRIPNFFSHIITRFDFILLGVTYDYNRYELSLLICFEFPKHSHNKGYFRFHLQRVLNLHANIIFKIRMTTYFSIFSIDNADTTHSQSLSIPLRPRITNLGKSNRHGYPLSVCERSRIKHSHSSFSNENFLPDDTKPFSMLPL